jgi:hypothetical protein
MNQNSPSTSLTSLGESARPLEHLAEGGLPFAGGPNPLVRAHRPHPLDPLGIDPQARGGRDRCPLLAKCRFPT